MEKLTDILSCKHYFPIVLCAKMWLYRVFGVGQHDPIDVIVTAVGWHGSALPTGL